MLTSDSGHSVNTGSLDLDPLCASVLQRGVDSPSAEERFHRLSVLGAHAVVDEDVEGGIDVGSDLQKPEHREDSVLVSTSCVQLRQEELHKSAWKQFGIIGMC